MRKTASFMVVAAMLFFPMAAMAQIVPCNGPDCDWGKLLELGQNILNFIITLSITAAALMFAYAGFLMFSDRGNTTNITKAKEIFWAVVIGLIIVLTAWLVVNTILDTLTGRGLDERSGKINKAPVDIQRPIV